jgi:hypothetical protein
LALHLDDVRRSIASGDIVRVSGRVRDRHAGGGPASHRNCNKKSQQASHRRLPTCHNGGSGKLFRTIPPGAL